MGAFGRVDVSGLLPGLLDGDEKKRPLVRALKAEGWGAPQWLTLLSQSDGKKELRNRGKGCGGGRRWEATLFLQSESVRTCAFLDGFPIWR